MKHGDHWKSIVDEISTEITSIIKKTVGNSRRSKLKEYQFKDGKAKLSYYAYPDTNLKYLVSASVKSEGGMPIIINAIPFCFYGNDIFIKINNIKYDHEAIDAIIEGSTEEGMFINFYDPLYFTNMDIYTIDTFRIFRLSGLAYSLFKTKPGIVELFDEKTKQDVKQRNKTLKIEIPTEVPRENGIQFFRASSLIKENNTFNADDYFFQAFIEEVSEFYLEERKIYQLLLSVGPWDKPIKLIVYAAEKIIEMGYFPKVGDNIYGYLWLQGYSTH